MKTLKPSEIAAYCDVHQRTVSRWIANGELKGHKLPGRGNYRVVLEDFLVFLKKFQIPVPADFQALSLPKILVIDDEEGYLKSLKRLFINYGYQVATAKDGFAAGVSLMSEDPALVTLDINMPGLNGFEVLQFIRQRAELADLKVIVISGLDDVDLQHAMNLGADAYLKKPFDNQELIALAARLLADR